MHLAFPDGKIGLLNFMCEFLGCLIGTVGFYYMSKRCDQFPFTHRKWITMATLNFSLVPVTIYGMVMEIFAEIDFGCQFALWPPLLGAVSQIAILIELLDLYIKSAYRAARSGVSEITATRKKWYRCLSSDRFVYGVLILMAIAFCLLGFLPPIAYPGEFDGKLPLCDVKNFWHRVATGLAVVFAAIQLIFCVLIYQQFQDEDGVFMRRSLFCCSIYTCCICLLMDFLKRVLDVKYWEDYRLYGIAMAVSHLISGAIYTLYPLYKSIKYAKHTPAVKKKQWTEFENLLLDGLQSARFYDYCSHIHAQHEYGFWKSVQALKGLDQNKKKQKAKEIYSDLVPEIYVYLPAFLQSEITNQEALLERMSQTEIDALFTRCQDYIGRKLFGYYDFYIDHVHDLEANHPYQDSNLGTSTHSQPQPQMSPAVLTDGKLFWPNEFDSSPRPEISLARESKYPIASESKYPIASESKYPLPMDTSAHTITQSVDPDTKSSGFPLFQTSRAGIEEEGDEEDEEEGGDEKTERGDDNESDYENNSETTKLSPMTPPSQSRQFEHTSEKIDQTKSLGCDIL